MLSVPAQQPADKAQKESTQTNEVIVKDSQKSQKEPVSVDLKKTEEKQVEKQVEKQEVKKVEKTQK